MKIVNKDEFSFIVFLNKFYIDKINFNNKIVLEDYFKNLFLRLKENYKIDMIGYYNIFIYIDDNYGIILEIIKEDIECFDYFGSQIDMQISKPSREHFLYQVKDLFCINQKLLNKFVIYKMQDDFYLKVKTKLTNIEFGNILELTDIIYGENCINILKKGHLVEMEALG
ncbi:MAG: hypothetical protein RR325_03030 [Bacilli bacterium]